MPEHAGLFELAVVAAIFVIATLTMLHLSRIVDVEKEPVKHRHEMEQ